jgi:hypothetical protein
MQSYNKRKIPILYYTANQLIEVKISFAFVYRTCSTGKYLVPKMHLTQLKIINSCRVIFFQEVTVFVMKTRARCITSIMHAGKRYTVRSFLAGNSPPDFQLH